MMQPTISILAHEAQHPFRRLLPRFDITPLVFDGEPLSDRQLFVMTFVAGFLAFYGFLS